MLTHSLHAHEGLCTVLVVDDEYDLVQTLRDVFVDEGFNVRTVSNGRDALIYMREAPVKPCLVILDLVLPILDGNAVYAIMKTDPALASVPVLVSTSDPSRAPVGAEVMPKPITLEALLSNVERFCFRGNELPPPGSPGLDR
ncbi:MAG: response regulator [Gemmatimonadota bacterium]